MPSFDNSVEPENPAQSGNGSGKLCENCVNEAERPGRYRFGEFEIDPATQRLLLRGTPVSLRNRPFEVLLYLVTHSGRLVKQSELLAAIWGASDVYHDALRKAVGSIRYALGDDSQQPRFIETHWGKGYRFIGEVVYGAPPSSAQTPQNDLTGPGSSALVGQAADVRALRSVTTQVPNPERKSFRYAGIAAGVVLAALFAGITIVARIRRGPSQPNQTLARLQIVSTSEENLSKDEERRADYNEAQYLLSQRRPESIGQAIKRFKQIVQSNPHSGDAYAGLAECYGLGYWGFWKVDPDLAVQTSASYAEKAVRVDPGSAYAHAQLAAALLRQLKIGEAQAEFARALAIRPNDAEVHHAYGVFLDDTHRAQDGIEEMKRAIELEPLSLAYKTDLGMSYFFAMRYPEAIAQYNSILKLDPGYLEAREYLASMYVYKAQWIRAKNEYAAIDRLRGTDAGDFGQSPHRLITEFKTGEGRKARMGVRAILASPSISNSYGLAKIYAQLGRSEDALRYLNQFVNSGSPEMFSVPDDPLLVPLHGNPEFEALANKASAIFTLPSQSNPVQAAALVLPAKLTGQ